jgi:hypothetical protein
MKKISGENGGVMKGGISRRLALSRGAMRTCASPCW